MNTERLTQLKIQVIDGDRGKNYPGTNDFFDHGHCLFLSAKNVTSSGFKFNSCQFINDDRDRLLRKGKLLRGDIVLTTRGTVGNLAIYSDVVLYDQLRINSGMVILRNNGNKIDTNFLYTVLCSEYVQKQIRKISFGSAQPQLTVELIKNFILPVPNLDEQQKIVAINSGWDLAIDKTERLIAAKEKRFTLFTQELIHNCTEGLQHFHLRDISEPITRKNDGNELNVLTTSAQHGLISQLDYYKKSVSAEDVRGYYLLKNGEFAYNRSSSNGYPYGAIKRLENYPQGVLSTLYLCFSLKNDAQCDSDFMAHAFEAGLLNKQLVGVCQEGARSHGLLNITKTDFFGLRISLPAITDQRKIAAILNTARQEIDLLKKQAEAYRRQKRGLMQKLLTGEWQVKLEAIK